MGPNETLKLLHNKGEKTALRLGENNNKRSNRQRINLKNIQATPAAQFQKILAFWLTLFYNLLIQSLISSVKLYSPHIFKSTNYQTKLPILRFGFGDSVIFNDVVPKVFYHLSFSFKWTYQIYTFCA